MTYGATAKQYWQKSLSLVNYVQYTHLYENGFFLKYKFHRKNIGKKNDLSVVVCDVQVVLQEVQYKWQQFEAQKKTKRLEVLLGVMSITFWTIV